MRENQEGPRTYILNTNSQQPGNQAIPQMSQQVSYNIAPSQNIPPPTSQTTQNMQTQYHQQPMYTGVYAHTMPRYQHTQETISLMSTQAQNSQQEASSTDMFNALMTMILEKNKHRSYKTVGDDVPEH